MKQKKSISRISMIATSMMIVCGLLVSAAPAMDESHVRPCSNRTLSANYGFAAEGVLIDNPGLPPEAPLRSVGKAHFDGNGNLRWVEHTVVNGTPLNPGVEWTKASGTYTVNPNCTGTAVVNTPNSPVPLNFALVVVRNGNEIHFVLDAHAIGSVFIKVADADDH